MSDIRTDSILAAAMETIQQHIRTFTVTKVTDPGCPHVLQGFISPEYHGKRWIDTVLGQSGFPSLKLAKEVAMKVDHARGFPGMQAAARAALGANRVAGFLGLKIARKVALEVKHANGFPNLKKEPKVNGANGFQNIKGALKKA
ncbi:hypothetical protein CEP54_008531 [Fusarium duplospermum]|uniref:Uncharacterized protein n=1 Tax=Fusarium duplospermum TaxID=1325734 RepID=A0A428PV99_9HYPO|nr:hypothetical protein CEP54_008531 [Fusarium duplospermum]